MLRKILFCLALVQLIATSICGETIRGEISEVIFDHFDDGYYAHRYTIETNNTPQKTYELIFLDNTDTRPTTGDVVSLNGEVILDDVIVVDSMIILEEARDSIQQLSEAKAVFIMLDLTDAKISTRYTKDQVSQFMTNVKQEFSNYSQGQFNFNIDANNDNENDLFGPISIDESQSTCDINSWDRKALLALADAGVDMSIYKHKVYLVSGVNCGWAGVAHLGCGSSCFAYINDAPYFGLYAHELGHNFRLHHASTDEDDDGGAESEYGDASCPMGYNYYINKLYNAPHLLDLGWRDNLRVDLTNAKQGRTFRLSPLQLPRDTAPYQQVITMDRDENTSYHFSYRQKVGLDSSLPSSYTKGLTVHYHENRGTTQTKFVRVIKPGETWTGKDLTITNLESNNDYAEFLLHMPCGQDPELGIEPSPLKVDQNGQAHGTLYITNNNPDGCAPLHFDLTATAEDPIALSYSPTNVDVPSGQRMGIDLTIRSPQFLQELRGFTFSIEAMDDADYHETFTIDGSVWLNPDDTIETGLKNDIYLGNWSQMPDFTRLDPVETIISPYVAVGGYAGRDFFAMHFQGMIKIDQPGDYTFYLASDDGSLLHLDNQELINHDGLHGYLEKSASINLTEGFHPIDVRFFEYNGAERITLSYSLPGVFGKTIVPPTVLFHTTGSSDNAAPQVELGEDQTIPQSQYHRITAQVSDPEGDEITSYQWQKLSGPDVTMNPHGNLLELLDLQVGAYRFSLTVTDEVGNSASDDINIYVRAVNWPPIVDAGPNQAMSLSTDHEITLVGTGYDPDGAIYGYSWQLISGPSTKASPIEKDSGQAQQTYPFKFAPQKQGVYVLRLTLTDNGYASAFDDVAITVNP